MKEYTAAELKLNASISFVKMKELFWNQSNEDADEVRVELKLVRRLYGVCYDTQSRLYWKQNKLEEAASLTKQAGLILLDEYGIKIAADSFSRLIRIYLDQGILEEEHEKLLQELKVAGNKEYLSMFGTANFMNNRYEIAESLFRKALTFWDGIEVKENLSLLDTQTKLLMCCMELEEEANVQQIKELIRNQSRKQEMSPPLTISKYLKTHPTKELDPDHVVLTLEKNFMKDLNELHAEALIEIEFENPVEGEPPIVMEQQFEIGKDVMELKSPTLPLWISKVYSIDITVYRDNSKMLKLGNHPLFIFQSHKVY